jgi:hypothetical protein
MRFKNKGIQYKGITVLSHKDIEQEIDQILSDKTYGQIDDKETEVTVMSIEVPQKPRSITEWIKRFFSLVANHTNL